jgi:hypothetical protein
MDDDELVFQYNPDASYERNFTRWFMMNCAERAEFGEQVYTQQEGLKVFKQFIKHVS